ncbi:3' terminal RNA ribose 2'-O-methyltransferase Hen1 [Deinococcus cellulosilyticus]|uniref:Small RNA 2'-O-methyltransferase n=1 Tax=Deinococcus cellulosilyticus (strain DSM 18568 / NBRC 106333 / KACC 11606 / 5516J-15) TaxID=1223518 RepID=A0A511MXW1_DEIC1|nr:3' terminal RNA ribose 2'-O-methyltransferase Hen1 [Deinococcus cellulosilyticus]GEM44987.1 3' terminal RNA ribose 2'-O-methyltransferase Hen1 [Deinococcus cellulosilyticus NBRC 106333 = KACC 11606]
MLFLLRLNHENASDLGYLLHKHPEKVQDFSLPFGSSTVFYPEVSEHTATACLMVNIDPVYLSRLRSGDASRPLEPYVNDRPYTANSFLSVALGDAFRTAMNGKSQSRPDLAAQPLSFEIEIPVLKCNTGEELIRRVFEPLGYSLEVKQLPLDEHFPAWGVGPYFHVTFKVQARLQDLLRHFYVLLPVLDNAKHYFIDVAEIEKLLRNGEGWLEQHPERELILKRYLKYRQNLIRKAEQRFETEEEEEEGGAETPEQKEKRISLNQQRLTAVSEALVASGAKTVLDLGCGEGNLLRHLVKHRFQRIVAVDASIRPLELAKEKFEGKPVEFLHSSVTYLDDRLTGFDAAALVEVIEHLDPDRIQAMERSVFGHMKPQTVVVTTPNVEYNVLFEDMTGLRHRDHRFEWTRAEFQAWAGRVAETYGYTTEFRTVGDVHEVHGSPTQMAIFTRMVRRTA